MWGQANQRKPQEHELTLEKYKRHIKHCKLGESWIDVYELTTKLFITNSMGAATVRGRAGGT